MGSDFFRDLELLLARQRPGAAEPRAQGFEKHLRLIDELNHAMGFVFDLDELLPMIAKLKRCCP